MSQDVVSVVGVIHPDCLYTTEGVLKHAGIGDESLRRARAANALKPIKHGKRLFYKGSELIRWIEKESLSNSYT